MKSPETAKGTSSGPVTVLVVDDNYVAIRLCQRVLERAGYSVLTASDGAAAVSLALAESIDMILLDEAMPGMLSLEAMRRIKDQKPGVPIVMTTAHSTPADWPRYLAAGAAEVLPKPFKLNALIAVVGKLTANQGPETIPPLEPARTSEVTEAFAQSVRSREDYGLLADLLSDPSVSEIMVNGPDDVFVERRGAVSRSDVRFAGQDELLETIRRIVAATGQHIDEQNPAVEAYLPDGNRVNAVIPPASRRGPVVNIRQFRTTVLSIDDLRSEGTLSPAMAEFLKGAVLGRLNILVSGAVGSGKTTTLNALAQFIPHKQRVVTIEEGAEFQFDHPNVVSLLHRPAGEEGRGLPTIRQLLRQAARMHPDRILLHEVSGVEAIDLLLAMSTGEGGSMSTIRANSVPDAVSRFEAMVRTASIDVPLEATRAQIASGVNLIIHLGRMPDGRRKMVQIAEVVGYDANGPMLRDVFRMDVGSDLRLEYKATGYVPTSLDKAAFYGAFVSPEVFDPVKSRFVPAGSDIIMPAVEKAFRSEPRSPRAREVVVQKPPQVATRASQLPPDMLDEMRKLIETARRAVADLQANTQPKEPQ